MSEPVPTSTTDAPLDFAAFEAAENAKALGQLEPPKAEPPSVDAQAPVESEDEPEPDQATAAPPATEALVDKAYTPPKPTSKRTLREQEYINERIRNSVREATERLQAEIADLKARQAPTAAEPAKTETVTDPKDPEPDITTYDDWTKYSKDVALWAVRQAQREADAKAEATARETQQREAQETQQTRVQEWVQRRDAFAATEPRFVETAYTFLSRVTPGTPLGDVLMDSPIGPQLALHLAEHPEDAQRIERLHPIQQIRELGKLEARIETDTVTRTSASAGPAAKTVTTAPAPPTTLAARSADPADPVAAAVARGDFRAFEEAENRKALASMR